MTYQKGIIDEAGNRLVKNEKNPMVATILIG